MFSFPDYESKDFLRALERFEIDDKLNARIDKAHVQREEFVQHFPIYSLQDMPQELFRNSEGSKDDFCHWITDRTKDVAQFCPWDRINLVGFSRAAGRYCGDERNGRRRLWYRGKDEFQRSVSHSLDRFVKLYRTPHDVNVNRNESQGVFVDVCRILGKPLALKLLVLYYPDRYINITRLEWLERVVRAFRLRVGYSEALTNHFAHDFYRSITQHVRRIEPIAFVELLNQYLGLGNWNDKEYISFLADSRGAPESVVTDCSRKLRELSRYVTNHRLSARSLMKIDDVGRLIELRDQIFREEKSRNAILRNGAIDGYEYAFDTLIDFKQSLSKGLVAPQKVKSAKEPRVNATPKRSDVPGWVRGLKKAKTSEAVASILCELGESHPYYRHYTTLCSLLAIAGDGKANPTLRLTRGDDPGMNDQLEWQAYGNQALWRRTFIVSFSSTQHENVAMWGLYSKPANEAVCLSFPRRVMTDWIRDLKDGRYQIKAEIEKAPGKFEIVDIQNEFVDIQLGNVLYGGDVRKDGTRVDSYRMDDQVLVWADFSKELSNEQFHGCGQMTGLLKSIDWFYEQEVRIIVRLKQPLRIAGKVANEDDIRKIKHLFLTLPSDGLMKLDYVLGPCVPPKLQELFTQKIKEVTKAKNVGVSDYNGKLKFRVG